MFFYEKENSNFCFELMGCVYVVNKNWVKKYNFNKRNKHGIAMKEKVEKDELEKLVIELTTTLYKQNKIFAKTIIRGV